MICAQRMCEGNGIGITYVAIKDLTLGMKKVFLKKFKRIRKKQQNNLFNEMVYHL
ncbi:hypothetical protein GCM10023262_00460 [Bartonella pachyuromydis]|uniref:Uncharacterized protein n=1 Tax=Bartonella pachyuromydis TaxID=931097 RepID=A0ABP8V9U6_9HYPH